MGKRNAGFGGESSRRAAAASAAKRRATIEPRPVPDAVTCDRQYDPDEAEFLSAMADYQARHRVRFPTMCEHLHVLKSLGYSRAVPA